MKTNKKVRDYFMEKRIAMLEPQVLDVDNEAFPFTLHIPVEVTPQARFILEEILPDAVTLFVKKNRNYTQHGRNISENFGTKGQFMKMYDKVGKLWAPFWEEKVDLEGEQPEEILQDLLGHVLLALYFLRQESEH